MFGFTACFVAALLFVIAPLPVYYSRYFIHEMLLLFFTALALGTSWRYTRSRSPFWAIAAGATRGRWVSD